MTMLKEAGGAVAEAENRPKGRYEATLIDAGWGSSGYYSEELLERDGPRVFPVGTHMYMNHPSQSESVDRPERDLRDLMGTIVSTPRMKGINLVAEIEVKDHWVDFVESVRSDSGLSIRANGVAEKGSAAGRDGMIVKALTEGLSVDFVTKAGRGGKIEALLESAHEKTVELGEARNAANYYEARIHRDFTNHADYMFGEGYLTRDERISLSSAIGDALTEFNSSVESNAPGLLERDPWAEAPGNETAVEENKKQAEDDSVEIKEAQMGVDEDKLSELTESVRKLEEADKAKDSKIESLEESARKDKERADAAENKLLAVEAGRIVGEALGKVENLPKAATVRISKTVLEGELPKMSDGNLDKSLLLERTQSAAKDEMEYIASTTGKSSTVVESTSSEKSDEQYDEALKESFMSAGMTEEEAIVAVKGR
jgi:hypothetical protein